MISKILLVLLCALPPVGWAEEGPIVAGPLAGVAFDQGMRALRPILGVPGAAHAGAPLLEEVDAAGVAPNGSIALLARADGLFLVRGLQGANPELIEVAGGIAGADRFAWSADGALAAAYSSRASAAVLIEDRTASALDLSGLSGRVTALAVDGRGRRLLVAVNSDDASGIYVLAPGAAPRLVFAAQHPAAVTLVNQDRDLYVAAGQQLWLIQNFDDQATPLLFADGLSAPVGLQLSEDGKLLFAADAGNRSLAIYDTATRAQITSIDLDFTPTQLERFGEKGAWLMNSGGEGRGPWYLLSAGRSEQPAVYFVPAGREE